MASNQVKSEISVTYKSEGGINGTLDNQVIEKFENMGAVLFYTGFDIRLGIRELCFTLQLKGE